MSQTDPIIVLGAGHNGLTAGAYLAKSGHKVLVLESRNTIGGIAATETLIQGGYRFNTGFANTATYLTDTANKLTLEKFGFNQRVSNTALFAARPGGGGFALDGKGQLSAGGFKNTGDAKKVEEFVAFVARLAGVFSGMLPLTPPDIKGEFSLSELWPWARVALKVKGLGEREMMDFIRVLPMSIREFLDEWFDDDAIRGAFALFSTIGTHLGPLGSGTTANFLYQFTGGFAPAFAQGGAGNLSDALVKAIEAHGGSVRLGTPVEKVLVENGKAVGVQIQNGEFIRASKVLSSLDPKKTLNELIGARHLPVSYTRRLQNIRMRGSTATVHYALNKIPDFGIAPEYLDGWITMCPDLLYLEHAYDDAKYGRVSEKPALLATIPTITDTSLAPQGHHVMSVVVRYAAFNLREGDYSALPELVTNTIEQYVPDFRELIVDQKTITPDDYAQHYGLTEGAWNHGQMGLDQLLIMRPIPGWSQYTTPIQDLYLCGSGSHPGGGITGAPGSNAAKEILSQ